MTSIEIFITTQFEAFHRWKDAPTEVAFLRDLHRHIFQIRAWKRVTHEHRDVEFILWKRQFDSIAARLRASKDSLEWSCETWAHKLGEATGATTVEVSEDGENGAVWKRHL